MLIEACKGNVFLFVCYIQYKYSAHSLLALFGNVAGDLQSFITHCKH